MPRKKKRVKLSRLKTVEQELTVQEQKEIEGGGISLGAPPPPPPPPPSQTTPTSAPKISFGSKLGNFAK